MTVYRLMDGVAGRPGNGPGAPTAFAGNFTCGTLWKVTANALWLNGYYHWVPTGGDTVARKCCLWQLTDTAHGVSQQLVPNSTVTSGTLTAGTWNFIPLPAPINLSGSVPYVACVGWVSVNGFSQTINQFGLAQPYAAGITNGPLFAYSDQGASAPEPFSSNYPQGVFGTTTADPTVTMPTTGDRSSNFWVDVQVTDQAPAGASYQLWPSQPYAINWTLDSSPTPLNFTLGDEFILSQQCTLNQIQFYSPAGATQLPTRCAIFNIGSQSIVAGTDNSSPSWSGAAGSGKVTVTYTGVTLAAGVKYKAAVFNAGNLTAWNAATNSYWDVGPGSSGITNGPLSAPSNANATSPGQNTYNQGAAMAYPSTYAGSGPNYWVDVLVTPIPLPPVAGGGGMSMVKRSLLLADL